MTEEYASADFFGNLVEEAKWIPEMGSQANRNWEQYRGRGGREGRMLFS